MFRIKNFSFPAFIILLLSFPLCSYATDIDQRQNVKTSQDVDVGVDVDVLNAQIQEQNQSSINRNINKNILHGSDSYSSSKLNLNLSPEYHNSINRINHQKTRFHAPRFGRDCVGSTCTSTSTFYIQGQHDEYVGSSVQLGIAVPFSFGERTAQKAMKTEARILENELMVLKERLNKLQGLNPKNSASSTYEVCHSGRSLAPECNELVVVAK